MLFFILFLILLIVTGIFLINNYLTFSNTLWYFKHCNCLVAGFKGTGKDLFFNKIIHKRKDFYYSNIDYSINSKLNREIVRIKDISIEPNDFNSFVLGNIEKIPHNFYDGKDFYISDIGNFLPSSMDSKLWKLYPSLPSFYSLSRHLYDSNVHCNSQNIERGWKAIREQAEFFIVCVRTYKIFGWLITKYRTYTNYESARQKLLPLKVRLFNKYSKAQKDLYYSQNGDIRQGFIFQKKKNIHYDTRAFEKVVLTGERLIYNRKEYEKLNCKCVDGVIKN